jgi:hypothetical protein
LNSISAITVLSGSESQTGKERKPKTSGNFF